MLEDTTDDTIASRVDLDPYLAKVLLIDVADSIRMDLSILELYPLSDTLHIFDGDGLIKPDLIDLLLHEGGVSQLTREVAIIGDEDDPRGISVQTTYGIDALLTSPLDEIHHGTATLGIIGGRHAVLRLIQQDIYLALGGDTLSLVDDLIEACDTRAKLLDDDPIDRDLPCCDEFVCLTTRADPSVDADPVRDLPSPHT